LLFIGEEVSTTSNNRQKRGSQSKTRKKRKKPSYKHVPHCDKPPQVVAKRNARERRRVHAVNQAFVRLRKAIPFDNKVKASNIRYVISRGLPKKKLVHTTNMHAWV
jgi:hypothetical protein